MLPHLDLDCQQRIDDSLGAEAERRGTSKAALIRQAVDEKFEPAATGDADDPWKALLGSLDDDPVDDIGTG